SNYLSRPGDREGGIPGHGRRMKHGRRLGGNIRMNHNQQGDLEHLVSDGWRSRAVGAMAQAIDGFLAKRLATAGSSN
ncbi:MAG: hypothetical protein JSV48_23815, partial [Bradyrhizobium sp.]